jgi:hypothetical protein
MNIPDKTPNKYDKMVLNYKQVRQKLKKLSDPYINTTDNKQVLKDIRDILKDFTLLQKHGLGIQKDDDTD